MTTNTIGFAEAKIDFIKLTEMVDEKGEVIILKDENPQYVLVEFKKYEKMEQIEKERAEIIQESTSRLISKNMEALMELAK